MSAQPLSDDFLDWWFAPWELGGGVPAFAHAASTLARRHGYRSWCDAAGLQADLPPAWDGGWQLFAVTDGALLRRAGSLYAAMLAARRAQVALLTALPLAERRWCMAVALTQPLHALTEPAASLEEWGLAELSAALEAGFAGLWSRLQIVLGAPSPERDRSATSVAGAIRSQRCWRMCLERAARVELMEAA